MDISQIFFIINTCVGCKRPTELIDKTKERIDEKPIKLMKL